MNSETLADIVAEMRNCQLASVTKVEKYNKDQCFGCDSHPACAEVAEFADRIEAAAEREIRAERTEAIDEALAHAEEVRAEKCRNCARTPVNATAMREALTGVAKNLALHIQCGRLVAPGDHVSFPISEAEAYIRDIRAALSAPPRNCDVGTAEEQAKRFSTLCNKYYDDENPCDKRCPLAQMDFIHGFPRCQAFWGQLPCEEEGAE